jgi:ABC-type branched-subunit amino acid transport system ATPase component/branched-subunit amino acid ABC-type transport system permease component
VQKFLNLVLSGTVTGAIYSIMASGIILTYQTSGIFNFAHGAVAFSTAFFYYELHTGQNVPIIPAVILSVLVFAPLLGLLLDRMLLRRLAEAPVYARIVGTIGLLVALPKLMLWLVEALGNSVLDLGLPREVDVQQGGAPGILPPDLAHTGKNAFHPFGWLGLPDVNLDGNQLAVFVAAAAAAVLLWFVVRRTRIGLEMRAVVDRESLASLRGVNRARTSAVAWILTMVLAGFGGILIAPLFVLNDDLVTLVVLGSLAAVALAGVRGGFDPQSVSIPLAFAGGLLLGMVQNLLYGYKDSVLPGFVHGIAGLGSAIPYVLALIILLFAATRARGRSAGSVADEAPAADHRAGLPPWRRRLPWVIVTIALAAFALQWFGAAWLQADVFEQGIIASGLVYSIIFLSFVVVTGLGGMVSLAQSSFVIAGGFTAGWAISRNWGDIPFVAPHGHLNFAIAALLGALLAAVAGALVALLMRGLGAVALALGTLAVAFVAYFVVFAYDPIGHGTDGWLFPASFLQQAPSVDFGPLNWLNNLLLPGQQDKIDFSQPNEQILLLLFVFGVLTLAIYSLQRSATGRAMLAARSSDVAARTSGISPVKQQVIIFAFSAAIAGLGGAMLGMVNTTISRDSAQPLVGLIWLAVLVTFGVRRPGGALIAGLAFAGTATLFHWIGEDFLTGVFHDLTSDTAASPATASYFVSILFGLGAINLAKNPDGLLAFVGHQRLDRRVARDRREHIAAAEAALEGRSAPSKPKPETASPVPTPSAAGVATSDALVLRGIVAGYGEVEVLHGVDVSVGSGQVVALLGANGAGKSTLCAVASGLLAPTQGSIVLDGTDVTSTAADKRARLGVLLVPEARGIFPGLSVEENLRVLLRSEKERVNAYERFPVLGERRNQIAGLLSGGEQQMLSLAPALAQPPKVFIADEPTLGLAPLAAEIVIGAIRDLRDLGCGVLLVEEKAKEVMDLADTVAFMELGRIVWIGPREQADADRLAAAYLGGSTHD